MLASRFASHSPVLRSDYPLSDDQIRAVVPSIYADAPHQSRSERYSYIPTAAVLTELRKEGFQPFMVTQTRVRNEDRRDHTLDRQGQIIVHRGLLREAEAKALRTLERLRQGFGGEDGMSDDEDDTADTAPKAASMTDRLAQRLSAHRTVALQIEVARHPQAALAATVHGMVQTVLQDRYHSHDLPLGVSLKVQDRLEGMAPDIPDSPAAVTLRELQQEAGAALPQDSAELFAALLAKPQDDLVRLLAVCVAATVDVVTPRASQYQPDAELMQAVGLDMAAWWQPTAEGYFKHVSKAVILDAVAQFAPEHVTRLVKLKKTDIASEAERLVSGTGWMPASFKAEGPQEVEQEDAAAESDFSAAANESAEALAA